MIELAPLNKIGLSLANPVLIAAGCCGYGVAYRHLVDLSVFGAIVTGPITLRPRRGRPQPRLVETKAGFILDTGLQNPGVKRVIRQNEKLWGSLDVPLIAHLPADEPDDLRRTARAVAGTDKIAAIELGIPPDAAPADIKHWVKAVRDGCLLPVLIKLPLLTAVDLVEAAVKASADALVIGSPPPGAARLPTTAQMVHGYLYGPAVHNQVLHQLQTLKELTELPLIAVGGIHALADAQAFIEAGAAALQIDSLLWVDPRQSEEIARNVIHGS